jgi:hypothetical protein
MTIHPDLYWLQDVEYNIQDANWRHENLDRIMESLDFYLSDAHYVLSASGILDICFEDMLGQGRYKELVKLHTVAIKAFDSDTTITSSLDNHEDTDTSNAERFSNEYFRLNLNLAHVAIMLHSFDLAKQQLEDIRELYAGVTSVDQLDACCIFLKYHAYGYEIDLGFDLLITTQRLTNRLPRELHLKGEVAIAGYHYFKGDIPAMKKVLQRTNRLISRTMPDLSEIITIIAE